MHLDDADLASKKITFQVLWETPYLPDNKCIAHFDKLTGTGRLAYRDDDDVKSIKWNYSASARGYRLPWIRGGLYKVLSPTQRIYLIEIDVVPPGKPVNLQVYKPIVSIKAKSQQTHPLAEA